jgi:hypothetical protein
MSTGTGVNVSKANVYAVLQLPPAAYVSKASAYAVLSNPTGVNVGKANAYAVLFTTNFNPPVWTSFTFAGGVIGSAYSQQWDLTPAASPTTYSVVAGSLPTGLSLTSPSGDLGVISGTTTVAGTYSFTLRATNAYGTSDQAFSITISAPSAGGGYSMTFMS